MSVIYIYIVKCNDNTYYTGITKDIANRIEQHNKGKVSYTRYRLPLEIIHLETRVTRKEAAHQERKIKNIGAKKYLIRQYGSLYNISLDL